VTLREATDKFKVDGARVVEHRGRSVLLEIEGDINDIVRGLANYELEDILYERMSLDELFLGYYEGSHDGIGRSD